MNQGRASGAPGRGAGRRARAGAGEPTTGPAPRRRPAATPSAKRVSDGTAESAHEKRAATARATSSGPWSPTLDAVRPDERLVHGRRDGPEVGGGVVERLAAARVRARELEPVLGGVDERGEHPEVAGHRVAVVAGPLAPAATPAAPGRAASRRRRGGAGRRRRGSRPGATARSTLRMPGRAPGRITDVLDCSPVTTRAARDVDVRAGSVGGGEPGAQERRMVGAVEDAAAVEDAERVVRRAVGQDQRHLQDRVDRPRPRPDSRTRRRRGRARTTRPPTARRLALGGEPARVGSHSRTTSSRRASSGVVRATRLTGRSAPASRSRATRA